MQSGTSQEHLVAKRERRRKKYFDIQKRLNHDIQYQTENYNLLNTETEGFLSTSPTENRTCYLSQNTITSQVDVATQAKIFKFKLSYGPYLVTYSQNGKYLLMAGRKGEMSIIDNQTFKSLTEVHAAETIHDVTFCHNNTLWAAAQKKYVHLYDNTGLELHCLREHMLTYSLQFLPYHYLLVTIGEFGELRWLDLSTGLVAAAYKTKQGACDTMCQNNDTGIIALGHLKGCVSFWSPNTGKPAIQFLGHKGKVNCMQFVNQNLLATAGYDGFWKIWDVRDLKQPVSWHRYYGGIPKTMSCSQTGMIALNCGTTVQIWRNLDAKKPEMYLTHSEPEMNVESLVFQPYEDFLCIGHRTGIENIVVPGSCLSNFDSHEADPYETKKQRREREIHSLLDKLPASTIMMNPEYLGGLLSEAKPTLLDDEKIPDSEFDLKNQEIHDSEGGKKHSNKKRALSQNMGHNKSSKQKQFTQRLVERRKKAVQELALKADNEEDQSKPRDILDKFRQRVKGVYAF